MRSHLQDAAELGRLGWKVLPLHTWDVDACDCRKACASPAKHPRTQHGLQDATDDIQRIAYWWDMWPAANIGVRTGAESGIVVIDIDPRHGGSEPWVALMREHDYAHAGPICLTGAGGMHLYFAHPGATVRNSAGMVAEGIDVRGDGGYVVAPPSIHMLGTSYMWVEGHEAWAREPGPVPPWLLALITQQDGGGERGQRRPEASQPIGAGRRNTVLASLGGSMRQYGMGETAIFNALMAENEERCAPPLDAREVAQIAASVVRYAPSAAVILPSQPNKQKAKARVPVPFTLAELEHEEMEPVRWAVPGLLPEGLAVLAGRAKLGKSWMVLGMLLDVAEGGEVFSAFASAPEGGDGLYLALEDTKRRLKKRAGVLRPAGGWPERVWCEVEWPRADAGGLEALEAWLGQHPQASLVVIDTFQKFKAMGADGKRADVYAADYEAVGMVKVIADRYGCAIVLVTHLNKGEHEDWVNNITGSTGVSGAADTLLNLDRPRKEAGQGDAVLLLTGRDVEEKSWGMQLANGVWTLIGDLDDVRAAKEYDETRHNMRQMWLDGTREVTAALYARFTGKRTQTANRALLRASEERFIERVKQGTYMLFPADQPGEELSVLSDHVVTPKRLRLGSNVSDSDKSDTEEAEW